MSDKFQKHVLVIMAFAFVTSYCFRQKLCFELIFYSNKLRSHLLECFENNRIAEFPLASKTIRTRRKKKDKTIKLQNYCLCNLPECFDDKVQCDKCKTCCHKFCVNTPFNIKTREPLYPKWIHGNFRTEFPRHAIG